MSKLSVIIYHCLNWPAQTDLITQSSHIPYVKVNSNTAKITKNPHHKKAMSPPEIITFAVPDQHEHHSLNNNNSNSNNKTPTINLLLCKTRFEVKMSTRLEITSITIVHVSTAINWRMATCWWAVVHAGAVLCLRLPHWFIINTVVLLGTTWTPQCHVNHLKQLHMTRHWVSIAKGKKMVDVV